MSDFIEANLRNWDERAQLHATDVTGRYRIDELIAGNSVLHGIEAGEIGDITGRRIAHLQCHIGLDTISLAHLGAEVSGLDFSPVALKAARDIAGRAGRDVRFVEADVYDAPAVLGETYDMVFVTWGAINWLPDIHRWARIVSALLEPGGTLYLAETHPWALCLEDKDGTIIPYYDWRTPCERPIAFDDTATYTGDPRPLKQTRSYAWHHPLSEIIAALGEAGLGLNWLHEHEELPYHLFPNMVPSGSTGLYRLPDGFPRLALSFSLQAMKR